MVNYVLRRIAGLIPTFLAIVTISFFILRLAPGGPFDQEQSLAPAVRANLEKRAPNFAEAEVETPAPVPFGAS